MEKEIKEYTLQDIVTGLHKGHGEYVVGLFILDLILKLELSVWTYLLLVLLVVLVKVAKGLILIVLYKFYNYINTAFRL